MVSKMILVFVLAILQCWLVQSHSFLESQPNTVSDSPIPVTELWEELHLEYEPDLENHYWIMAVAASYGGQLYQLSANLSLQCFQTLRASFLMLENFTISAEASRLTIAQFRAAVRDLKVAKRSKEHPLELWCQRLERSWVANSALRGAFKAAMAQAAEFDFARLRAPYARTFPTTRKELELGCCELLAVPEFARAVAVATFADGANATEYSGRINYLVKCCQAVARSARYTDAMQSLYEKVLDEVIPEITAGDAETRYQRIFRGDFFWIPSMAKKLYQYVASDATLKKELEMQAAIVGEGASPGELDFSKL